MNFVSRKENRLAIKIHPQQKELGIHYSHPTKWLYVFLYLFIYYILLFFKIIFFLLGNIRIEKPLSARLDRSSSKTNAVKSVPSMRRHRVPKNITPRQITFSSQSEFAS